MLLTDMENPKPPILTTASGIPYTQNEDSMSVGARGPLLLQDVILHEKMAHFNRERIPERVVHAKGTGVFGTFTVTHNISNYTKAKIFGEVGKETSMFARFSVVGGEKGGADTERDPRGFALKFYTEDGNWDLVGNNTPVFFVKDPKKFSDFIHTQKRDPRTNCKSPTMMWDFFGRNPESLHQVLILMSDRGTPFGYRHMHGFGSHTFSMINAADHKVWVKFHFKTMQGVRNFTHNEAVDLKGKEPDFAQMDMVEAIDSRNFPKWAMKIQVMTMSQASASPFNPFDVTKVWPHHDYPLIDVGEMELNRIPKNYFAEVEQSAFAPSHVVDGISYSPDKMLQGRLLTYPDAQRYRLGANYEQIPVNRCPYMGANYERDGAMRIDGNGEDAPNYATNSVDYLRPDPQYGESPMILPGDVADWYDRNGHGENDHYTQPGLLFTKVMTDHERYALVANIVVSMGGITGGQKEGIINRQLCHFFRADQQLGSAIARGLRVNIDDVMKSVSG